MLEVVVIESQNHKWKKSILLEFPTLILIFRFNVFSSLQKITKSGIMTPLHGCAVLNESQGNF